MMKFPSIDKHHRSNSDGEWWHGADVSVDPRHIIAVEPRQHRFHSFRPAQEYSVLHLSTGGTVEVFASAARVEEALNADVDARIQARRGAVRRHA